MNLYKGKNLEDVLDKAADGENVDIEYLQYRIVSKTDEEIEIESYFVSDVISYVEEYLKKILNDMGIESELKSKYEGDVININIKTNHDALIIGSKGITLQAFNEIIRAIISARFHKHFKILLDVGDYKEEKYEKLIQKVRKLAKEVQQTKGKIDLDPMPSDERRVIHNALSNYHNVKTESSGQGKTRKISIFYVEEKEKEETEAE